MSMLTVCVVGVGGIGSRHLQALRRLRTRAEIFAVDPMAASLELARTRFESGEGELNPDSVMYAADLHSLPERVDVAIVATPADVRRTVVEQLLGRTEVRYLILEKVLFQRLDDLDAVGTLLGRRGVPAWVNCPRRMFSGYQALRRQFQTERLVQMTATGSSWNLAGNAIHLLDLAAYLSGSFDCQISAAGLEGEIFESKRPGYVECCGTLAGSFRGGPLFAMHSADTGTAPLVIVLTTAARVYVIDEGRQRMTAVGGDGQPPVERPFPVAYQSALTATVVEQLVSAGDCDLTPIAQSSALHRPLLSCLQAHFAGLGASWALDRCAIT